MSFLFGFDASVDCQLVDEPFESVRRILIPSAVPVKSAFGVNATSISSPLAVTT